MKHYKLQSDLLYKLKDCKKFINVTFEEVF